MSDAMTNTEIMAKIYDSCRYDRNGHLRLDSVAEIIMDLMAFPTRPAEYVLHWTDRDSNCELIGHPTREEFVRMQQTILNSPDLPSFSMTVEDFDAVDADDTEPTRFLSWYFTSRGSDQADAPHDLRDTEETGIDMETELVTQKRIPGTRLERFLHLFETKGVAVDPKALLLSLEVNTRRVSYSTTPTDSDLDVWVESLTAEAFLAEMMALMEFTGNTDARVNVHVQCDVWDEMMERQRTHYHYLTFDGT